MAFGRVARLTAGPSGGGTGTLISDLYMTFEVKKALLMQPYPSATIKVWNQNEDNYRTFMRRGAQVILQAGYLDESTAVPPGQAQHEGRSAQAVLPPFLFSGTIRSARRYKERADWIVELLADGGSYEIGSRPITVSFPGPISLVQIFAALPAKLRVPILNTAALGSYPFTFNFGFSYGPGTLDQMLRQLLATVGFAYTVGAGQIVLFPPARSSATAIGVGTLGAQIPTPTFNSAPISGYVLSKDTGLLLPPEHVLNMIAVPYDGAGSDGTDNTTMPTDYWKITALLFPQIGPGTIFQVVSPTLANGSAFFQAYDLVYTGDTRQGDWKIEAQCVGVDSRGNQIAVEAA